MRLLVVNDDGIFSPGLQALAEFASTFGEVRVVAPDVEQSSVGSAITSTRPLSYRATRIGAFEGFRVNGTPADCVALGIHNWERVDAVLSGINQGYNVGNAIWHSGTLAAARQAALFGVKGIALSAMPVEKKEDYEGLRPVAQRLLEALLSRETTSLLFNVNLPPHPRGIAWTKFAVLHYDGRILPTKDPWERPMYWFTAVPIDSVEPGTDLFAVRDNLASVTPLSLDMTDEAGLLECRRRLPFPAKV
jgi:5'-nucleotidase